MQYNLLSGVLGVGNRGPKVCVSVKWITRAFLFRKHTLAGPAVTDHTEP